MHYIETKPKCLLSPRKYAYACTCHCTVRQLEDLCLRDLFNDHISASLTRMRTCERFRDLSNNHKVHSVLLEIRFCTVWTHCFN